MLKRALRWKKEAGPQAHSSDSESDSDQDGPDEETRELLARLEAEYGAQLDALKAAGEEVCAAEWVNMSTYVRCVVSQGFEGWLHAGYKRKPVGIVFVAGK